MTPLAPENSSFVLRQPGGRGSDHFAIDPHEPASWSHITVNRPKETGTSLALHPARNASRRAAAAREQKLSARPGAAESARAIAGAFDILDDRGELLATTRKNLLRSIFRTTWELKLADGSVIEGRETNPAKIALRRLLMLADLVIDLPIRLSSDFAFRGRGRLLFTVASSRGSEDGMKVTIHHPVDERVALLQSALTRAR